MKAVGEMNRLELAAFIHPDTVLLVEFPPGPLGIGDEFVKQIDEISTDTGVVRIISPTDCVKDRLAWYYHDNDTECLEQAVLVAAANAIDIGEVKRWSAVEGKQDVFDSIRHRLQRGAQQDKSSVRTGRAADLRRSQKKDT